MLEKPFVGQLATVEYPIHQHEPWPSPGVTAVGQTCGISPVQALEAASGGAHGLERWREFSDALKQRPLVKVTPLQDRSARAPHRRSHRALKKAYRRADRRDRAFQADYEQDQLQLTRRYDPAVLSMQRYLSTAQHPNEAGLQRYDSTETPFDPSDPPDEVLVQAVMQRKVKAVLASTPLETAASLLNRYRLAILPVVDEHHTLVGVIGLTDILDGLFDQQALTTFVQAPDGRMLRQQALTLLEEPVRKYMNPVPITVAPTCSVREACEKLLEHDIGQVIVTEAGLIRGLFSAQDALRVLAQTQLRERRT